MTGRNLPCGHPVQCLADDHLTGEQYCGWCSDLEVIARRGAAEPVTDRACIDCPKVYSGPLKCPDCGAPGEPVRANSNERARKRLA